MSRVGDYMNNLIEIDPIEQIQNALSNTKFTSQLENSFFGKTNHFVGDNLYVRRYHMKKGLIYFGRVHKVNHVAAIICGKASIWSNFQNLRVEEGFKLFEVPAGTQRILFIHEDMTYMTMHCVPGLNKENFSSEIIKDFLTTDVRSSYIEFTKEIRKLQYSEFRANHPATKQLPQGNSGDV